jgi:hypothetical protein
MHGHSDGLWYALAALALVVGIVSAWIVARVDAKIDECPDREKPELHPDDDDEDPSARYAALLRASGVEPDRVRYPGP